MRIFGQLPWSRDDLGDACSFEISLKNEVRIEQITHDEVEPGEVIRKVARQFGATGKKSRKGSVFDGADRISIEAPFSQRGDVGITQDLDMRTRIRIAQCLQRRKCQDEIANGSPADHQNPIHGSASNPVVSLING